MFGFMKRNLRVFFRDRSAVFFSLLSSFIIIGLYVLFLGDALSSGVDGIDNIREIMDNWIMAGLLAVTPVTTTMGAFSTMVSDKETKISKDFYSSPISRRSLAGGYVSSALVIGFIMSMVTLVLAEVYIVASGGSIMSITTFLKVVGIILVADVTSSAMMFFITAFFSSNSAFSTASTIIGTLIGFVTGIYLAIGMLPGAVQWIVKLFPASHGAVLLRQVMTEKPVAEGFADAPAEVIKDFQVQMGIVFEFGSKELSSLGSFGFLIGYGVIFFALAVVVISRKRRG